LTKRVILYANLQNDEDIDVEVQYYNCIGLDAFDMCFFIKTLRYVSTSMNMKMIFQKVINWN